MLPRTDLTISPVGRAEALGSLESTADPRQQAFQRSMATLLGQSLQGDVLSKLTDGSYLVKVAGTSARMLLPPGAQVGTQVPLTLVALSPRPTFQISSQGGQLPLAYSEAGPALLPGPPGAAGRAAPLVYMEGGPPPSVAAQVRQGQPAAPALPAAAAAFASTAGAADDPAGLPPGAASAVLAGLAAAAPARPGLPPAPASPLPLPGQPAAQPAPPATAQAAATPAPGLPATPPPPPPVSLPTTLAATLAAAGAPAPGAANPAAAAADQPPGPAPAARPGVSGGAEAPRTTSHAAVLLSRAPLVPASQLPAIDPKSTPATLSEAARVITGVLTAAQSGPRLPSAIMATTPLVASAAASPQAMAAALKDAVGHSGLFYESHVAEWSAGKRPVAELLHEPQMQRAPAPGSEAQPRAGAPADPATAQFINLQLQTQEHARLAWQGQLWPGQDMQWEIQRDAPERQHGGETPPEQTWRSALRLRFELLGNIGASVVMVGEQIHIQLEAGSSEVGALLREHAAKLDAAMEASGNPLSSLNIRAGRGGGDG